MSDIPKNPSPYKIVSKQLTTCNVSGGGKSIRIEFEAEAGGPVSVEIPFSQAESLIMTLPHVLSAGLKMQTGDAQARYVFPMGSWSLESAKNNYRILSVRTSDGFEVAFAMSVEAYMALGSALTGTAETGPQDAVLGRSALN
ncbi:hypothetical protein V5F77_13315 [Xanthobacter sp. DSM 24535]|uniref:hypothetical protein n=1 Tax=Roseixanthobacter psychrophilus TaxID=3119917 RepID=UPI003728262A